MECSTTGETYLIVAQDLVALDKADGTEDGVIDLANVQRGSGSYRFVGGDERDPARSLCLLSRGRGRGWQDGLSDWRA